MEEISSLIGRVGIFFLVNGKLLLHTCSFDEALSYGDFLNYPLSHDHVWIKHYHAQYKVDFDYWPRGRIIYNTKTEVYTVFYDKCMEDSISSIVQSLINQKILLRQDEHYQCHLCNRLYAFIDGNDDF